MAKTKPSEFKGLPYGSVKQSYNHEQIAKNIMVIMANNGDTFREVTFDEYLEIRMKDGASENAVLREKRYFDDVIDYMKSPETVSLFCPSW